MASPTRPPSPTDFTLHVEGVGSFVFGYRKMPDELKIAAEFSRICEGVDKPNEFLQLVGNWIATLRVLTVRGPEGWDLDELDPLSDEDYAKLAKVYSALRAKEDSFRSGKKQAGEGKGEAVG
jgi:hypothetical protein